MSIDWPPSGLRRVAQRGVTLVEQIMFIVIVSVGVIGLVSVLNPMIRRSADPMQTKQLMAIAESILGEVLHQSFSWCDPEDTAATTAIAYAGCVNPQSSSGPVPASETRSGGVGAVFDNVADYAGWSMSDVSDVAGGNVMTGYSAAVAVAHAGTAFGLADNTAALSVTVTVTRGTDSYALTGYRFRYAPRY